MTWTTIINSGCVGSDCGTDCRVTQCAGRIATIFDRKPMLTAISVFLIGKPPGY